MCSSCNAPIGIFDSGVGGISVLCTAAKLMPNEDFIYYADNAFAPYGTQTVQAVKDHSFRVANWLLNKGVKAIVVACNTATSAAIKDLRDSFTIPIIGMEPALKPAIEKHGSKKIIVLATPMTLANKKFNLLMNRYGKNKDIVSLPAPKLVEMIESGNFNNTVMQNYLKHKFNDYLNLTSAIVLGCTHFLYIANMLQKLVGKNVVLVDGNIGTIRQLANTLARSNLLNKHGGNIKIWSSGDDLTLKLCNKLYEYGKNNLRFYE